jgi:hypothetical protein
MIKKKYRLTRLNDGLVKEARNFCFVSRDRDGAYNILKMPSVDSFCNMYNSMERIWRTTNVTDFNIIDEDNIEFTTINSKYKLEKI